VDYFRCSYINWRQKVPCTSVGKQALSSVSSAKILRRPCLRTPAGTAPVMWPTVDVRPRDSPEVPALTPLTVPPQAPLGSVNSHALTLTHFSLFRKSQCAYLTSITQLIQVAGPDKSLIVLSLYFARTNRDARAACPESFVC